MPQRRRIDCALIKLKHTGIESQSNIPFDEDVVVMNHHKKSQFKIVEFRSTH